MSSPITCFCRPFIHLLVASLILCLFVRISSALDFGIIAMYEDSNAVSATTRPGAEVIIEGGESDGVMIGMECKVMGSVNGVPDCVIATARVFDIKENQSTLWILSVGTTPVLQIHKASFELDEVVLSADSSLVRQDQTQDSSPSIESLGITPVRRAVNTETKEKEANKDTSETIEPSPLSGMTFIKIPSGSFTMGSPSNVRGRKRDERQHEVSLSDFYIQSTEVTQEQWIQLMESNPSNFVGDSLPVENVSWNRIQEFLSRLNELDPGRNYRLPTEAEWEYACLAGGSQSTKNLNSTAWYDRNAQKYTHVVASLTANEWGIYDMLGNVWEWCSDWYMSYPRRPSYDPKGPLEGRYKVVRGGSWTSPKNLTRPAARSFPLPNYRASNLGFRCVKDK